MNILYDLAVCEIKKFEKHWFRVLKWHWLVWRLKAEALPQARNQLGTAGGAKSFLRGGQIFWTMSNSFKLCPPHFSMERRKIFQGGLRHLAPPLVTGLRCPRWDSNSSSLTSKHADKPTSAIFYSYLAFDLNYFRSAKSSAAMHREWGGDAGKFD